MCKKWDLRYLNIAKHVASWSKDPSTKIGAVIVGDKGQIVSQGFNGFARGIEDKPELLNNREEKYKRVIHAEMNAIYNSVFSGSSPVGCTMYITGLPVCHTCADGIIQTGIKEVVMDTKPSDRWIESCSLALEKFKEAGVKYRFLEDEE